jgi:hypothetical protein
MSNYETVAEEQKGYPIIAAGITPSFSAEHVCDVNDATLLYKYFAQHINSDLARSYVLLKRLMPSTFSRIPFRKVKRLKNYSLLQTDILIRY